MELYIFTFEDGQHYVGNRITQSDINAVAEGILTIIRCSDAYDLLPESEVDNLIWAALPPWNN